MATPPLVDLSSMDLTRTLHGKDVIDKYLLQTGQMRMLDRIIWQGSNGTTVVGAKLVREDEFWVDGHIPGRPLFPGVMMIESAAQLCSFQHTWLGRTTGFMGFTRCDDVVFRGQVVPGDDFIMIADEIEFNRRRFICKTQGFVNGKMVFEATITGMAI
ncbi:MAG: beta-hydroxyacyl-ACP dehydratase [Phycisphaerales bacterium]|nr:beta-hydroxyacyl-ACP dehydratase [Phycisphaerales bacterium]